MLERQRMNLGLSFLLHTRDNTREILLVYLKC